MSTSRIAILSSESTKISSQPKKISRSPTGLSDQNHSMVWVPAGVAHGMLGFAEIEKFR